MRETTMDLLALADFDLVATHGGYSQASRASGRPKATLSRRVIELEGALGVRLIERGPRTLRLTEAGAQFHARTRPLLDELRKAAESTSAASDRPRGPLRVSAPVLLADTVLGRVAAGFTTLFPEVQLDVTAEDRIVDLAAENYDVVIRVDPPAATTLVGRCVLRDERWLVAAPSFVRPGAPEDGTPTRVRAAVRNATRRGTVWTVRDGERVSLFLPEPVMRLSTLSMLRDAAVAGAGAALLPRTIAGRDVAEGRLVRWGVAAGPPAELWALHNSRRHVAPKVTAFIRHLATALADPDGAGSNAVQGRAG